MVNVGLYEKVRLAFSLRARDSLTETSQMGARDVQALTRSEVIETYIKEISKSVFGNLLSLEKYRDSATAL